MLLFIKPNEMHITYGAGKKKKKKNWFKMYSGVHRKQLDKSESYSLNKHLWLLVNIKYWFKRNTC